MKTDAPVTVHQEPPASAEIAFYNMLERVVTATGGGVEAVERFMQMKRDDDAVRAKRAYFAALARAQPLFPTIERNGRITITDKQDKGRDVDQRRVIQSTAYALLEDITEAVKPVLAAHGFSLFHRFGMTPEGKVTVNRRPNSRGRASGREHRCSHARQHGIEELRASSRVHRTPTASVYTTVALLNITSRAAPERDDDGKAAAADDSINDEQFEIISRLIMEKDADMTIFCRLYKIEKVRDLRSTDFEDARRKLEQKKAKVPA